MTRRDILASLLLSLLQLLGLSLLLVGAFLYNIAVGLSIAGLVLLGLGWALDRKE